MNTRNIITTFLLILTGSGLLQAQQSDIIREIREELFYSDFDLEKGMAFYSKIVETELTSPLIVAYQGAAKALIAKYAWNPITKINALNSVKELLSEAVRLDKDNLEIRFLRFYIESHIPDYLGYNKSTEEDCEILINNVEIVGSLGLEKNIYDFIVSYMEQTLMEKQQKTAKAGMLND